MATPPAELPRPPVRDVATLAEQTRLRSAGGAAGAGLPARIDRFVVLRRLGAGGMGVVLAAYDPDLDRKVALKLLRPELRPAAGEPAAPARLVREAQAMARLSHPNVLPVFDVGTFEGQVYLAMELVEGETLAAWLQRERRSWREIRRVFLAAGEGLAAAHQAGILHRDFKPSNVLIGRDGRVRVADFGISRALGPAHAEAVTTDSGRLLTLAASSADGKLTGVGRVLGTPAYIAPELVLGEEGSPRADQFSFAVALWEALYGVLPFGDGAPDEVARRAGEREPEAGDASRQVPAWLRRIAARGLQVEPAQRYPTLPAMLADLAVDRSARRRRWLLAAGGAAAALLAAVGLVRLQEQRAGLCSGAEARLAGVWDRAARGRVEQALLATGKPYAAAAASSVAQSLDRYERAWRTSFRQACEATRVRGEQSEELLDLRMRCLDQRRSELRELVRQFEVAAPEVIERAGSAAASLPPVAECDDALALAAPLRPPPDTQARAAVAAVREQLARAKSLEVTGQYRVGLEAAQTAENAARASGYAPVLAEALRQRGVLEELAGDSEQAESVAYQALAAAARGRHDRMTAQVWSDLVWFVGFRELRLEEGERFAEQARAALDRMGGDELLAAELDTHLCGLYARLEDYPRALAAGTAALAVYERVHGPEHPLVGRVLNRLGMTYYDQHDDLRAREVFERALELTTKAFGPLHPTVAVRLNNIALVAERAGELEEALSLQRRAIAIEEAAYGPEHPQIAIGYANLSALLGSAGRSTESLAASERALAISEATLSADNPDLGESVAELGEALLRLSRFQEALAAHRRALRILEPALGPDHEWTLGARLGEARALLGLERPAEALPRLRAILAARLAAEDEAEDLAATRFALARAIVATGGERNEALALAAAAREGFQAQGKLAERDLRELARWQAGIVR